MGLGADRRRFGLWRCRRFGCRGPCTRSVVAGSGRKARPNSSKGKGNNMDVYIGLDVSLVSTAICVLGEKGKIVTETRVASAPESLVSFMSELPDGIAAIGLEAGPLSQWLHKGLTDAGFETVMMETRQVKAALKATPIKTDRRDAEGIARLLQMGWFRPVHCKTVSSQEIRALLISRKSVKDTIINMELSLRGVLRNFGLKLGPVSKGRYEVRVRGLIAGNAMLEAAAEPILHAPAALRREFAELEKLVRNLARQDRAPSAASQKRRRTGSMNSCPGTGTPPGAPRPRSLGRSLHRSLSASRARSSPDGYFPYPAAPLSIAPSW